jgi:hypothetical protein
MTVTISVYHVGTGCCARNKAGYAPPGNWQRLARVSSVCSDAVRAALAAIPGTVAAVESLDLHLMIQP